MTAEDLLTLIRRQPFVPFVLVTTDGTRYEIPSPEFVTPLQNDVIVGMPASPVDTFPESTVRLSLDQVRRLEIPGPGGKVGG
jgi:hypothetical protein